jgi:tRNA-Thr(GGU) m(6)t(6)A37 methyltransferase TsaA
MDLTPIGTVRSSYREQAGTPIQPAYGEVEAEIRIEEPFRAALADLEGFERIWVITWLDRAGSWRPRVVPYRDTVERGLFSTRAPSRPNPVGLSCVRLLSTDPDAGVVRVAAVDLLDGTPVLDLKPYLPAVDAFPDSRAGWFEASRERRREADGRFEGREGPKS